MINISHLTLAIYIILLFITGCTDFNGSLPNVNKQKELNPLTLNYSYINEGFRYFKYKEDDQSGIKLFNTFSEKLTPEVLDVNLGLYYSAISGSDELLVRFIMEYFKQGYTIENLKEKNGYLHSVGKISEDHFLYSKEAYISDLYSKIYEPNLDKIEELQNFINVDQQLRSRSIRERYTHAELFSRDSINLDNFSKWLYSNIDSLASYGLGKTRDNLVPLLRHLSSEKFLKLKNDGVLTALEIDNLISTSELYYAQDYVLHQHEYYNVSCLSCVFKNDIVTMKKRRLEAGLLPIEYCYIHYYHRITMPSSYESEMDLMVFLTNLIEGL